MQEGWLGDEYWILFSTDEALAASRRYRIEEALPGCTIIGLVSWDDFVVRDGGGGTYAVPTVPIAPEHQRQIGIPSAASLEPDDRLAGKVKWYVTPLVFGGDPEAAENLAWVTHDQHAELVLWWNAKYREIRSQG